MRLRLSKGVTLIAVAIGSLAGTSAGLSTRALAGTAELQQLFVNPPDDARINVRWWWFGPAVTKPGIEREMKSMKAGGIGGFEVQPTYPLALDGSFQTDDGRPLKNLKFLSPEFLDMLRFTASEAKELGMRMDLTLGSGWPYGGSMFSPSEGAGRIIFHIVPVNRQAAVPAPVMEPGQQVIAAFIGLPRAAGGEEPTAQEDHDRDEHGSAGPDVDAASMKEVLFKDGTARVPAGAADNSQIIFCIAGRTGMQVKRPALGAEGLVIDHLNPAVVNKFIRQIAEPEMNACAPNPPFSIFCDSLEVTGEDWTGDFLTEFQKRRGYDLQPLLPALIGDIGPETLEVRHDWGQTLTELYEDAFNTQLTELAHRFNTRFRLQAYGSPSAGERSYLTCDLPEGEGYHWHAFDDSRYAASACHLMGVPVASSETFTWLHSPVFRATPLDIKAQADLHFLQGINQIVCHGWPYTPQGASYPGWAFYAAAVFDEKNPWYVAMPDITRYLQRISALLRQGRPANDVALYLADDDAWADFTPGKISLSDGVGRRLGPDIIPALLDHGFNFDFFDDHLLDARGKVDGGTLAFGDLGYKAVVLAGVERIPLATMRMLEAFAEAGGTLIATRTTPSRAPGYLTTEQDDRAIRDIASRLFNDGGKGIFVRDESELPAAIEKRLRPDVSLTPIEPDIGFVHRHTDGGEVYFLANTSNVTKTLTIAFRVTGRHAEVWNPMTAQATALADAREDGDVTRVPMTLAPYESRVVVFGDRQLPVRVAVAKVQPLDISSGWQVKFDQPAPGSGDGSSTMTLDAGTSWTASDQTRGYSGVATYLKTINIPAAFAGVNTPLVIDFGDGTPTADAARSGRKVNGFHAELDAPVREAAVVFINGHRAGAAWCSPYRVDITGLLRAGANQVRIEVGNLAVNAIAAGGKYPNYDYDTVRKQFGERFQPQDVQALREPQPAGLLGKIVIEAKESVTPSPHL